MDRSDKNEDIEEEDITLIDVIETLGKEIPRIMAISSPSASSKNQTDRTDQTDRTEEMDTDVVISMIESLKQGEEPTMIKICSGMATQTEINEWASKQGIGSDQVGEVLEALMSSFSTGVEIAQQIEENMDRQSVQIGAEIRSEYNQEKVLTTLNGILSQLDTIRKEVTTLINYIDRNLSKQYHPSFNN